MNSTSCQALILSLNTLFTNLLFMRMENLKDFIDVWNNSNCASSLNATVLYWIINTDCGLLSFQTEEFLILT